MSDADLLRRAAQLARETAEAAPRGPHTVDTTEEAPADATDRDKILRIVAVWVDTAARTAVTDIDDRIPTWTLQRAENEWVDVVSELSIPAIRDRHTEHTKADPEGMYRVVRFDEPATPREN